jgi:L-alanine-DL-glutamate epimerase-like enolase superfamily enzyme
LEGLGYLWLEKPLPDEAAGALAELTRSLDIPVIGGEVLAKRPYALADYCARRVVDGVRADVSWSGGVTGTLKTAHLAEAFHMQCEIHTAIFHALEMVNLHVCGAIRNSAWFEVLWPMDRFDFALPGGLPIVDGMAILPQTPGLGATLDRDMIENATLEVF